MKRLYKIIISGLVLTALTACTSKTGSRIEQTNSVDKVLNEMVESTEADTERETQGNTEVDTHKAVDIDLTAMDRDMTYATVYQLMVSSEDYIGKTVRVKGEYNPNWYEPTQKYYHCVLIKDAAACCAQGMEFIWGDGSYIYPDDYPATGSEIEVTGTFETYREEGILYCRLGNAELKLL